MGKLYIEILERLCKMNITFIAPGLNSYRGGERVIYIYAKGLAENGHNVTILVPKGTVTIENKFLKIIEYDSIFPAFYSRQIGYIDAISALSKIPKSTEILIGTYIPQLILPILYKIGHPDVKFVIFNQDFITMFNARFDRKLMYKIYPKFADKIISISKYCASDMKTISNMESIVIKNGVEEDFLHNEARNSIPLNYIFWLGSKNSHKGFECFYQAMKKVWRKYPNIKLFLPKGICKEKNKNIKELIINGNKNLLKNLYSNATLFVCSSISEGFGLPALEAMCCGCPVVTTNTGGSEEYAINGYNSIIVEKCKPEELANAITKVLDDENLRILLSKNGIKTSFEYEWKKQQNLFNSEITNF